MPFELRSRADSGLRGSTLSLARLGATTLTWMAIACALQSCGDATRETNLLDVRVHFDPLPYIGETTCHVALFDRSGQPIHAARIDIEGNMNHAGMVPVLTKATELASGSYSAPFEFTMGGDWILLLHIVLADGTTVDEVFDVPAVPVKRDPGMNPSRSLPVKR